MIDWIKTKKEFGIDKPRCRTRVCVVCDKCGVEETKILKRTYDIDSHKCRKCVAPTISESCKISCNSAEVKKKNSENSKKKWRDPKCRQRMQKTPEGLAEIARKSSMSLKKRWQDPKFREKSLAACTKEVRHRISESGKRVWKDPEYRKKMSTAHSPSSKKMWEDPEYRKKIQNSIRGLWQDPNDRANRIAARNSESCKAKMALIRSHQPRVSSLQDTLYSILDDLGVKYYRERGDGPPDGQCSIGPYNFDCVIPREGKTSLLIECQGEYWHGLAGAIKNDQSKASYIANNLSDKYELKSLWEHEFKCKNRIIETIKYWLGMTKLEVCDFDFNNTIIKECPAKDYRPLLAKYHYLSNAGRGGVAYGVYLDGEIIGVCIFSPLVRQNIKTGKYTTAECRELSRLCIHPRYQKKNFASWFVSRCIKALDPKYKMIISYCDTTFNHDGAIYKACNFKKDGEVRPDYWYVDSSGWVMHKKTLYDHAKKMSLTESEYARKHGYKKIYGTKKLRFTFER